MRTLWHLWSSNLGMLNTTGQYEFKIWHTCIPTSQTYEDIFQKSWGTFWTLQRWSRTCWTLPSKAKFKKFLSCLCTVQEYADIFQEFWRNILKLAGTYFRHIECYWVWVSSENLALLLPYLWIRLNILRTCCKLLGKIEFKIWLSCLFMGLVYGREYWWHIWRLAGYCFWYAERFRL